MPEPRFNEPSTDPAGFSHTFELTAHQMVVVGRRFGGTPQDMIRAACLAWCQLQQVEFVAWVESPSRTINAFTFRIITDRKVNPDLRFSLEPAHEAYPGVRRALRDLSDQDDPHA